MKKTNLKKPLVAEIKTEEEREKKEDETFKEWKRIKGLAVFNPIIEEKIKHILKKYIVKGKTYFIQITKEPIKNNDGLFTLGICDPLRKIITLYYHLNIDYTYVHEVAEAIVAESGHKFKTPNEREQLVNDIEDGFSGWLKQTNEAFNKPKKVKKKIKKIQTKSQIIKSRRKSK